MLTQSILSELRSYGDSERCRAHLSDITRSTIRAKLKKGQHLYSFNRDKTGIDTYVFVSWFETSEGGLFGVLNQGEKLHHSNMFVSGYIARDIALSTRGTYDSECFFVDLDVAKRKLRKYIKAKSEKLLADLSPQK